MLFAREENKGFPRAKPRVTQLCRSAALCSQVSTVEAAAASAAAGLITRAAGSGKRAGCPRARRIRAHGYFMRWVPSSSASASPHASPVSPAVAPRSALREPLVKRNEHPAQNPTTRVTQAPFCLYCAPAPSITEKLLYRRSLLNYGDKNG